MLIFCIVTVVSLLIFSLIQFYTPSELTVIERKIVTPLSTTTKEKLIKENQDIVTKYSAKYQSIQTLLQDYHNILLSLNLNKTCSLPISKFEDIYEDYQNLDYIAETCHLDLDAAALIKCQEMCDEIYDFAQGIICDSQILYNSIPFHKQLFISPSLQYNLIYALLNIPEMITEEDYIPYISIEEYSLANTKLESYKINFDLETLTAYAQQKKN